MRPTIKILHLLLLTLLVSCSGGEPAESKPTGGESTTEETQDVKSAPDAGAPKSKADQTPKTYGLEGRVTDPWNDPVPAARVLVVAAGEAEDATPVASGESDEKGEYRFEVPASGPWTIHARQDQVGVASVTTRAIDLGEVARAPDVRLTGEGRFAGVLFDAAGSPLPDLELVAFSKSLLQEQVLYGQESLDIKSLPLYAPLLDSAFFTRGEGFHYAVERTNAAGKFRFEGLAPGEYLFYVHSIGNEPWLDVRREWFQTGDEDMEIRSKLCNLEISVAHDGVGPDNLEGSERRRLGALLVFPTLPAPGRRAALLTRGQEVHGGDRNVFWLPAGEYVVRGITYPPAGQWGLTLNGEAKLEIQPGEAVKRFELTFAPQDRPTGRLRVDVEVPEGFDAPKTFRLLTAETAQSIEISKYSPFPELVYGEWLDIPEGEYLAALKPFEDFVGRPEVVEMGNIYRRIKVIAGEETECKLVSTFGGTFRLKLKAERFSLEKDLIQPDGLDDTEWQRMLRHLSQACGATITLVREDGGPALPLRLRDPLGFMGERRERMLPGETFENFEPVEPGDYTLWVLLDGFLPSSTPITIEAGKKTEVTVELVTE